MACLPYFQAMEVALRAKATADFEYMQTHRTHYGPIGAFPRTACKIDVRKLPSIACTTVPYFVDCKRCGAAMVRAGRAIQRRK